MEAWTSPHHKPKKAPLRGFEIKNKNENLTVLDLWLRASPLAGGKHEVWVGTMTGGIVSQDSALLSQSRSITC